MHLRETAHKQQNPGPEQHLRLSNEVLCERTHLMSIQYVEHPQFLNGGGAKAAEWDMDQFLVIAARQSAPTGSWWLVAHQGDVSLI